MKRLLPAARLLAVVVLAIWFCQGRPAVSSEARVALIIGNSAYPNAPLKNPLSDARAVAHALNKMGFEVILRANLGQRGMIEALREFGAKIQADGVSLFFFAGHGIQVNGRNYLIPTDADIRSEDEIPFMSIDAYQVLAKMDAGHARVNLVILDACRDNPFIRKFRTLRLGLAQMDAPGGTLIAFSTAPGSEARDGEGVNSIYTKHLLAEIAKPGLPVEIMFRRVREGVVKETENKQIPWESSSLMGDFYFRPPDPALKVALERQRREIEQKAIDKAVAEALQRSGRQAAQDRAELERVLTERIAAERAAAERAAAERAAAERIAAMERTLREALRKSAAPPPVPATVAQSARAPRASAETTAGSGNSGSSSPQEEAYKSPSPTITAKPSVPETSIPSASAQVSSAVPGTAERSTAVRLPRVGDTRTYKFTVRDYGKKKERIIAYTVEKVTATEFVVRDDRGGIHTFDHEWNKVRRTFPNGQVITWHPSQARYSFPLTPGKTWEQRYEVHRPDKDLDNDTTCTVEGWESVSVSAGTFQALKVTKVNWYSNKFNIVDGGRAAITLWFAPEINTTVKSETLVRGNDGNIYADQTQELISYHNN